MSQGTLYESPASVTNRPRDMRIDPATVAQLRPRRESKAWIGWLLVGLIVGGGVVDVWHMYQERLARDERLRQEGFVDQGNGVWVRERPGQRTVITLNGGSE